MSLNSDPLPLPEAHVTSVRRFNRLYTQRIGALDEGHLHSPFSLASVRVLYEIAHRERPTATAIGRDLRLDPGYMSRLLRDLEKRQLIERIPSATDGRRSDLRLTEAGQATFADLDARARADVAGLLGSLTSSEQRRLVAAMNSVASLLEREPRAAAAPYLLRGPEPGDLGWVVQRNGALYAEEYGWNQEYEGLVARIVADYVQHLDPPRERCWIAERDGEKVGAVFVVRHPELEGVARLRLLLVEPAARGLGIGRRLVDECTRFARQAGYRTLMLWTNSNLVSARRIYEAAGYRLVHEEAHHSFGRDLTGQTWELTL
jgi:DNA-binding MarR family transcriptional regulator/GNAT superfamily N-acetyltransferase